MRVKGFLLEDDHGRRCTLRSNQLEDDTMPNRSNYLTRGFVAAVMGMINISRRSWRHHIT